MKINYMKKWEKNNPIEKLTLFLIIILSIITILLLLIFININKVEQKQDKHTKDTIIGTNGDIVEFLVCDNFKYAKYGTSNHINVYGLKISEWR